MAERHHASINVDAPFSESFGPTAISRVGVPVGLGVGAAFALAASRLRQGKLAPALQR
jgi:hypothetical protein